MWVRNVVLRDTCCVISERSEWPQHWADSEVNTERPQTLSLQEQFCDCHRCAILTKISEWENIDDKYFLIHIFIHLLYGPLGNGRLTSELRTSGQIVAVCAETCANIHTHYQ